MLFRLFALLGFVGNSRDTLLRSLVKHMGYSGFMGS